MKKPIHWGIWGTGAVAHAVASDFRLADRALLHAVASRTEDRARKFAACHGASKSYAGLAPLLHDPAVDVIYIATPNDHHMADSIACLRAGKAVLCEKPFALDLEQAQKTVDTARQHKVFCMEAMWTRFIPAVIAAKSAIKDGVIGPIRMMQGNFAYPIPEASDSRLLDPKHGGGALLDRGVYLISLSQHLLGTPLSIRGTACLGPTCVDEQSAYQLVYKDALSDFAASLRTKGTNEVTISGERGMLRLCEPFYRAHRLVTQTFAAPQAVSADDLLTKRGGLVAAVRDSSLRRRLGPLLTALQGGRAQNYPFSGNGYQFELQHVSDCLREQRIESPIMPLSDTLEVMRTMDALRSQMYPSQLRKIQSISEL